MSGKWQDSDRSKSLPADWKRRRLKVLRRDNYQCQWVEDGKPCSSAANEVDHFVSRDNHEIENLQSLCRYHHSLKTQREAIEGRALNKERVSSSFRRTKLPDPFDIPLT